MDLHLFFFNSNFIFLGFWIDNFFKFFSFVSIVRDYLLVSLSSNQVLKIWYFLGYADEFVSGSIMYRVGFNSCHWKILKLNF